MKEVLNVTREFHKSISAYDMKIILTSVFDIKIVITQNLSTCLT